MTSPLRRKRPITVRSTPPATTRSASAKRWEVVVLVAVGILAGLSPAMADSSNGASTYSTGRSGSRLKWLPQRPATVQNETAVSATGYTTSSSAPRPLRTAQNQSPSPKPLSNAVSDPFDDGKKDMPTPAKKSGEDSLPQIPLEPKPQGSLPPLDDKGPSATEKPYVAPETPTPAAPLKPAENNNGRPLSEREFEPKQHEFHEGCPSPKDLKNISELTTNITPAEGELPRDCPLGNATFHGRSFAPITYAWTASGLCHKPLYFEDVQLERYGHMGGPLVQPLASFAHFFATFPILPYKMGLETPNECMYSLGYYRPGNCAPYLFDPIPLSVRGAFFEAGAWIGGVYAFP